MYYACQFSPTSSPASSSASFSVSSSVSFSASSSSYSTSSAFSSPSYSSLSIFFSSSLSFFSSSHSSTIQHDTGTFHGTASLSGEDIHLFVVVSKVSYTLSGRNQPFPIPHCSVAAHPVILSLGIVE